MAFSGFISDGYTREFTIAEDPQFHPALTVSYRPMLAAERFAVSKKIGDTAKAKEYGEKEFAAGERIAAEAIAGHVKTWSLLDCEGNPVAINADNALRIEPHLSAKLFKLIMGDRTEEESAEKN